MSLECYHLAQAATENPRATEYRLFALITKALVDLGGSAQRDSKFHSVVDWNRRLWLTLQTDLASDGNRLPDELRAKLISIAIWVDKHSSMVIRGQASLKPLIEVNRSIMDGLSGQAAVEDDQHLQLPSMPPDQSLHQAIAV